MFCVSAATQSYAVDPVAESLLFCVWWSEPLCDHKCSQNTTRGELSKVERRPSAPFGTIPLRPKTPTVMSADLHLVVKAYRARVHHFLFVRSLPHRYKYRREEGGFDGGRASPGGQETPPRFRSGCSHVDRPSVSTRDTSKHRLQGIHEQKSGDIISSTLNINISSRTEDCCGCT